jgi:RNA polymerase sigma-70 factor (ECF subfamily)
VIRPDPLANPEPLIRRVYAYAAYRLGDGPDAEDATSDTFERALRYRKSYDKKKGEPAAWLLGIARRCVDDVFAARPPLTDTDIDSPAPGDLDADTVRRLSVRTAVLQLDERSQELIALRYGADLTARQIARLLHERTNTIEVALHRALGKLRAAMAEEASAPEAAPAPSSAPAPDTTTLSATLGRDV